MMRTKRIIKNNYKLVVISILLAVIGHGYFLSIQFVENQYMMSPADQFTQMIIFKDLLYNEFTQGNFFYSLLFNGGSNLLSRLSYYYSTSLMFYITTLFTYFLELLNVFQKPSMVYWASMTVFISVFRSILILFFTTKYINLFIKNERIALLGATFYTFSSIYFRHVALWEFFGDAMIWLPIILYGVELVIRKKDGKFFTIGVALTLFNNGYFAFANLLFTLVYIALRFLIRLSQKEVKVIQQIKYYLVYGLLGVGISLPGFIPFVKGFFNTSRLSPEFSIPAFELLDFNLGNLLLNDRIQVLPILFVLIVTNILNYKSRTFRFFSIFSFVLIILRYNPFVASLFNGLSYPQFRWHYMSFLMMAVVIALGVKMTVKNLGSNLRISSVSLIFSLLVTIGLYFYGNNQVSEHYFDMTVLYLLTIYMFGVFFLSRLKAVKTDYIVLPLLFASSLYTIYATNEQLYDDYNLQQMNYDKIYSTFDDPNNPYERSLEIIRSDANKFHRIDFTDMHNLGSQKNFSSFNVYNSFHNNYQQYFYRYHQIINSRENNGIIDGLAGRQILNSLFQSDYVIASERDEYIVPTGFELIEEVDDLGIYKNEIPVAFVHPVHNLYSENEVNQYHFKDELLVNGAIVKDQMSNTSLDEGPQPNELEYMINDIDTEFEGNKLIQSESYFNIEIALNQVNQQYDDVVIDYTISPLDDGEKGRYTYSINGYSIQLKSTGDPYSSQLYRHQAHLPYNEDIVFNLAPGTDYIFEIHAIYGLSHNALKERRQVDQELDYKVELDNGKIEIVFNNMDNYPLMVLPLFYENGWSLEINGEKKDILNVNNGMIGFEIPNETISIQLSFRQPLFFTTISLSILNLFVLVYIEKRRKQSDLI